MGNKLLRAGFASQQRHMFMILQEGLVGPVGGAEAHILAVDNPEFAVHELLRFVID